MVDQLTPQPSAAQVANRERSSMRFWVFLICCFFALDFTVAAIAITMAAGDPSFRSIPGYGERATAWDVRQARKKASTELGWTVQVQRSGASQNELLISVRDAANQPVVAGTGLVRMFHFTRVAEQFEGSLVEREPGVYYVPIDVAKSGRWQMELEVHAGGDRHFWDERTLNWFGMVGEVSDANQ